MLKKGGNYEFKDVDLTKRQVTGYLSAFDNVDSDNDIIKRGAYASTIAKRGPNGSKQIKYLLDHDTRKAVGRFISLEEDNFGLKYTAELGRHTLGKDFAMMVEDGIITEHSVGISVDKGEQIKGQPRVITEVTLWEGSALQFLGANSNTPITGFKSDSDQDLAAALEVIEKALQSGTYTDQTYKSIILPRYRAIQNAIEVKELTDYYNQIKA
jgi:HK97 family phage prohead protease